MDVLETKLQGTLHTYVAYLISVLIIPTCTKVLYSALITFLEMCVESLNTLRDHGLINMDEGFDLKPTGTDSYFLNSLTTPIMK